MAIALVTHTKTSGLNSSTSSNIDTSGADLLLAHVSRYAGSGSGACTVDDSKNTPNPWTGHTEQTGGTNGARIYDFKNPTVGAGHNFSTNGFTIATAAQFAAFSGCDTTAPFDVESGNTNASTTSLAPGALTPTNDGELIWTGVGAENGESGPIGNTSLTSVTDQDDYSAGVREAGAAGYVVLGAGTGGNPYTLNAWTWTGATAAGSVAAAYKAAAGGGGGTRPVKMAGLWGGYAGIGGGFAN